MDPKDLRSEFARIGAQWLRWALAYGVARVLTYVAAWSIVSYAIDRGLSLPSSVRVALLVIGVAALVQVVRRWIVYPLRKAPSERDVACAIERRFPQFDGRLLSVLELEGAAIEPARNVSVELVERLRAETASLRKESRIEGIFEFKPLKRVAGLAAAGLAIVLGFAALRPELASIYLRRAVGMDARWPQRTLLAVSFPESGTHFQVEREGERPVRVRIARGASLPVAVTVNGEDPESVELIGEAESGSDASVALSSTGDREWAGRFRSVRETFKFRPVGGDDDGEGREVDVEVFAPPAVSSVETSLRFPAYTGLESRREPRGDVEAPFFTSVTVDVTTADAITGGRLVFDSELPSIDLVAAPSEEGARNGAHWTAQFEVDRSCAYSIHLIAESGFKNLEPPTYSVLAIKDRPPTVRLLEPARGDIDVTPDGIVAFRVAADDDYGITELFAEVKPFGAESGESIAFPAAAGSDTRRRIAYEHYDLRGRSFARGEGEPRAMQTGESLVYKTVARDNFVPPSASENGIARNETALLERRVDIVSGSEKLRLLTERQIRTKEEVRALRSLQVEKVERLETILKEYESSEGDAPAGPDEIAGLEVGQNQVTTRSLKLCREFGDIFEEYLLNRLDPSSGSEALVAIVLDRKRNSSMIDGFDVAMWKPLVESNSDGSFGRLDVLGRIFEMLGCLIAIADQHSTAAARHLSEARIATDEAARPALLRKALGSERAVLEQLDLLISKLDEWENFQEVLGLFRALIDDQRELNERTRRALK